MVVVKVKSHYQVTLPPQIRAKVRVAVGDLFEAKVEGRTITLVPKRMISRAGVGAERGQTRPCQRAVSHRSGDSSCSPPPNGMTASFTLRFRKQYQHLSAQRQATFDKQLGFLFANL